MSGLVGVIAQDTARFSMFGASLSALEVPPETQIKWVIGHNIASSMNDLVDALYMSKAEWLFILGDDHVFSSDLLLKLLAHDRDIVVPLCLTRMPPYKPVVFSGFVDESRSMHRWRLDLNEHPDGGLVPIHSAGTAGMVVRRRVFEELGAPWFEVGKVTTEDVGEDVYFCDKARDAGFELFADLDTVLGHCTTATVWPVRQEFGWTYGFGFMGGLKVTMPGDAWATADLAAGVTQ